MIALPKRWRPQSKRNWQSIRFRFRMTIARCSHVVRWQSWSVLMSRCGWLQILDGNHSRGKEIVQAGEEVVQQRWQQRWMFEMGFTPHGCHCLVLKDWLGRWRTKNSSRLSLMKRCCTLLPELLQEDIMSSATDVYSYGILWEMLGGKLSYPTTRTIGKLF